MKGTQEAFTERAKAVKSRLERNKIWKTFAFVLAGFGKPLGKGELFQRHRWGIVQW